MIALLLAAVVGASPSAEHLGPPIPAQVRRVVTLAPSLTETVIALGAGDRLVGVSRYDELPRVKNLPRVGGYLDPSVEAVAALHPDLVLVQPSPGNRKPVEKMAELGIPVLALRMQSVAQVLGGIRAVGKALGLAEKGEQVARALEQTRQEIRGQSRRLPHPRVLFVYGFAPLVVAGPGSFADALLRDAGAKNAAVEARSPYPVYSVEVALRDHPEVVIDASGEASTDHRPSLPGLESARWIQLSSQALLHPGPRLGEGLRELFGLLHPKQEGEPSASAHPPAR